MLQTPLHPPCLSFPTRTPQMPPQGGAAMLEQPQNVILGGNEGGKTTHPQSWGTGKSFLTSFSRLALERGER